LKKYLFVLGKNLHLSLCELSHILQYPPFKGKIIDFSKQVAVVEFENVLKYQILQNLQFRLGGTQKICELIESYPKDLFIDGFPLEKHPKKFKKARTFVENEISIKILPQIFLNVQHKKIMFAVSVYPYLFSKLELSIGYLIQFLNQFIKKHLEKDSNKVKYFKYPEKLLKSTDLNPIWPHHVILYSLIHFPNAEIVLGFTQKKCYIAKTIAVDNPNINKMIDERRPSTEFEISIPPKIAKILINLLNLSRNGKLLDPFCGTGTILMMAMLQGINFYGTDINRKRLNGAIENLQWLAKEFGFKISKDMENVFQLKAEALDSCFENNFFDGIATEPFLGPPLKKPLPKAKCKRIIKSEIKPLYKNSLKSMHKVLKKSGKLAIISPVYRALDNTKVELNLTKIAENIGFKILKLLPSSIFQIKGDVAFNRTSLTLIKDQNIMRKINLFQKI